MSSPVTFSLSRSCIEPVQRMCGGEGPRWVVHRFPIKGGITWARVIGYNLTRNNVLLARLRQHG